ncbi:MAG: SPFH domain-containing protein [Planctomycetes bacterium]|nr:SPFH domain-containing protein [Planctomycetota bacterium]
MREHQGSSLSGYPVLFLNIVMIIFCTTLLIVTANTQPVNGWLIGGCVLADLLGILLLIGLFMVNPNEARVLQLFGAYRGTVRIAGLRWASPFYWKGHVSARVRNFESEKLKVNDFHGNPIEIAAVIVWRVADTAEALFNVDDYANFVHVQSEAAVRNLAMRYPYDAHEGETIALRSHPQEIAEMMKKEIQDRLDKAGVEVIEARISHLAYAPEIASAMLQRQQAGAIIAARQKIVDGAVGMVEMALQHLAARNVVHLDDERKAAMVSNLLVVLCGHANPQPVVNAGSIY